MINPKIPFDKIFKGKLKEQIMVYENFARNMKLRNNMKQTSHPGINLIHCYTVRDK